MGVSDGGAGGDGDGRDVVDGVQGGDHEQTQPRAVLLPAVLQAAHLLLQQRQQGDHQHQHLPRPQDDPLRQDSGPGGKSSHNTLSLTESVLYREKHLIVFVPSLKYDIFI